MANIGATGTPASVTVAIGRDVAIPPGKANHRSRLVRIAATIAVIIRNNRDAAAPAGPTGLAADPACFGRNGQ